MKNFSPVFIAVLLLAALSVWGCGQQKTGAINAKISELESRYTKLEEDYRTLQTTHDLHRKKLIQLGTQLTALEAEKTDLTKQLELTSTQRETLRQQVGDRTKERDTAQANLMQFSKDLQALAGRVESAVNSNSSHPTATIVPASRRTE